MDDEPKLDIKKQIAYWRDGALEALDTAQYLLNGNRVLFGLFAAHLALEKALKAHVVKQTENIPPRIHDLLRLAERGKVKLSQAQIDFLGMMNLYAIEGRYADMDFPAPSRSGAQQHLLQAKEISEWLVKQL